MKRLMSVLLVIGFLFTLSFILADDLLIDESDGNAELIGGCAGVAPDLQNECCQNLGYDSWDSSLEKCVNETYTGVNSTGVPTEEYTSCINAGGTWKQFNNGCADTCDYIRNPESISCIQALTDSCDCGPDKCWNGEACETNEVSEDYETEPPMVGGCGTVTPGLNDECCQNLGYDKWSWESESCVLEDESEEVIDESLRVCCKIYGYGSEMQEVNVRYAFVLRERCSLPENFVGGNREIVDSDFCKQPRVSPREMNQERKAIAVQNVIQARNRLEYRIQQANGSCPSNCTCDGSTIKCMTQDGSREMIIRAGNSGNTIVQVKNIEMGTSVALFKADDGGVFGVFKNNETKRIILPDEAKQRLEERMKQRIKEEQRERKQIALEDENITLNEEGYYEIQAKKRAKLFWLIPVKEKIHTQIDAETGDVIKVRNSWWGFLARDLRVDDTENSEETSEE